MKSKLQTKQAGFTIVEVVLVLAIAGLIFLIVFLALPQLQRSRRDTQRRSDIGRALSAMEQYSSNNNGAYPADTAAAWGTFVTGYLTSGGGSFNDPQTGAMYQFTAATPTQAGQMQYQDNSSCNGQVIQAAAGARNIAIVTFVETGGTYCQDNT